MNMSKWWSYSSYHYFSSVELSYIMMHIIYHVLHNMPSNAALPDASAFCPPIIRPTLFGKCSIWFFWNSVVFAAMFHSSMHIWKIPSFSSALKYFSDWCVYWDTELLSSNFIWLLIVHSKIRSILLSRQKSYANLKFQEINPLSSQLTMRYYIFIRYIKYRVLVSRYLWGVQLI